LDDDVLFLVGILFEVAALFRRFPMAGIGVCFEVDILARADLLFGNIAKNGRRLIRGFELPHSNWKEEQK
jgi:hypothetical protein